MATALNRVDHSASHGPSERLRFTTAAVRVSIRWFGVSKTLTPEQRAQAADGFGAESDALSARKKLLDTKHPAFKQVVAVRGRVLAYWRGMTLPFPEAGVRLIKQANVEAFHRQMLDFQAELQDAVSDLEDRYADLRASARTRLGELYDAADYPDSLHGLFDVEWDFPSVEPPEYLLQLNPAIYEQEKARVSRRFDEAVQLAEQAFVDEFSKLISHLTDRLSPAVDGKQKIFRDSSLTNVIEFFDRFRQLNVRSNAQLDQMVDQAKRIVGGLEPQALRENGALRQNVATQLSQVQSVLDGMLVDRPRRNILRGRPKQDG